MKPILGQFICIVVKNVSNFAKMCLFAKITSQLRVVKNLQKNDRNVLGVCKMSESNKEILYMYVQGNALRNGSD